MTEFPILMGSWREYRLDCPRTVPWEMLVAHEEQAMKNHGGQTLARLAERGGLCCSELMSVLEDRPWHSMDAVEAI